MEITWKEITQGFAEQVRFCQGYSPLYHALYSWLEKNAAPRRDGLPLTAAQAAFVERVESAWAERSLSGWLEASLLMAAAIHAAVLGDDPAAHDLRQFYATVGGDFDPQTDSAALAAALDDLFTQQSPILMWFLREGRVQTNETSRSLGWLVPAYVFTAWQPNLSITLVDLGTSAGLNLSADHQHWAWQVNGQPSAPSSPTPLMQPRLHSEDPRDPDLARVFGRSRPPLRVINRVGIDRYPLDVRNPDHKLALQACIWGDQPERLRRLEGAIEGYERMLAAGETPRFFVGDILEAAELLARLLPDQITPPHLMIVFNSAVTTYFSDADYDRLRAGVIYSLSRLPTGAAGIWLENEPPRYNETVERDKHFLVKAHLPFMGGVSHFFLGETEAHPQNLYLRAGWGMLREMLGWET